jgi:choline dehydrogenase-like flavoprotein
MLSGIGPMEHLEELGIQTILDLPVGKYLQDHPGIDLENGGFLVNTTFGKNYNTSESIHRFIESGLGPLGAFNFEFKFDNSGTGYSTQIMRGYLTSSKNDDGAWPELQIYVYSRYQPKDDRQEFYFAVELVRHATFGRITLASKDPHDKPVIDPNLLADPEDVERMVDGIEVMMDVFLNSTTFQKYGIQRVEGSYKPCEGRQGRDYWRCLVEHKTIYFYHPTSTCRMGPNSKVAVLDSKMKVFGTQNLRVMDASSMPFAPSGNTNLPAMLMGARGAEIILSEQGHYSNVNKHEL